MHSCGENGCRTLSSIHPLHLLFFCLFLSLFYANVYIFGNVVCSKIYGYNSLCERASFFSLQFSFILNIYSTNFFKLLSVSHGSIHCTCVCACFFFVIIIPSHSYAFSCYVVLFNRFLLNMSSLYFSAQFSFAAFHILSCENFIVHVGMSFARFIIPFFVCECVCVHLIYCRNI